MHLLSDFANLIIDFAEIVKMWKLVLLSIACCMGIITVVVVVVVLQRNSSNDSDIENLTLELRDGKVQGTILNAPSGRIFYSWKSIPFAKPPLGELRFQSPVRSEPWTGILDGTQESKACIFVGTYKGDPEPTNGNSEDCLYMTVYTPVKPSFNLSLPVIFYIYGGGLIDGSGDIAFTDPTAFLEEGEVILVFSNYRLGFFGFLSTEDEVVPGNVALKDQLAALIWTNENIASFGGNPKDITLLGHSAGAVAIGYHLVSPKSSNLFSAAILLSGTCLNDMLSESARRNAWFLASQVNSSITATSTSQDILQVLEKADADLLVNISLTQNIKFLPVIEIEHSAAFLTKPFYESLEAGNFSHVPMVIGMVSAEKLVSIKNITQGLKNAALYDGNSSLVLDTIRLKNGVNVHNVTQEIKQQYVGNGTFTNNLCGFVTWWSDNDFGRQLIKHGLLHSKFAPVYFYYFSFVGTSSINNTVIPGCGRVAHAQELGYLFNISTRPIKTEADFLARRRFVKLLTNFAKTKNPTPEGDTSDLLQSVSWEPFDETNMNYVEIGDNLESKSKLKYNTTIFWDYFFETYSYHPYNTY